jgi:hypothetical protein
VLKAEHQGDLLLLCQAVSKLQTMYMACISSKQNKIIYFEQKKSKHFTQIELITKSQSSIDCFNSLCHKLALFELSSLRNCGRIFADLFPPLVT